ncbi:MAG: thiamine pyrophosphate-binding protein [Gemmatimonadetes bacterium]|nr:thiamine pyrophosphate-binding protein [Gemmatimonadota bacterium]NIX45611.1 thiamine pyrophosphate-binding protein [Gemmatimonadota bacterium]
MVRALEDEGIPFTFGIPGTHNIELYDALAESDSVRPILVTDEQAASFMADAVWRASGALGCVNVVPGAGLTHAMSGIAEAWMDTVPMLVLGCGIRTDTGHGYQLHDVDQMAMVAPVTKAQLRPERGEDLYATVRQACRLAREGVPGPVYVEVPANLYLFTHDVDLDAERARFERQPLPRYEPDEQALDRVAGLLESATRPLLYLGLGALAAEEHLVALAERLEAPVATTFQGKGVFPETHPLSLWPGFGASAPPFARQVAGQADLVLAIGCRFGEVGTGSYGLEMPGPLIHVDIDPDVLGRNYPAREAINADAALVIPALLDRLRPRPADRGLRERIAEGHRETDADRASSSGDGVSPFRLLRAIQSRLGPDTVFTADSGNGTFLAMETLRLEGPRRFLAPVDYSCMGYSVPAAVGAKLAAPDRPVVALAGDGAFLMTGLEVLTAGHYEVPAAVFVLRDGELAQIAQFQQTTMNRKTASGVHDYDLAGLAAALGLECLDLRDDAGIPDVLDRVAGITAAGRPVVVDVAIDYGRKTYFTRGVVKTNLLRLPWKDRLRLVGRAVGRRILGG